MRYFLSLLVAFLLLTSNLNAQKIDTSFKKDWIAIDSIINKNNLTKTALNKANSVYARAKQRQLPSQVIKALIYKMELEDKIKEDNQQRNIQLLNDEIVTTTNTAAKSILYILLAKQYETYYQNNRWNINERKESLEKKKDDFTVWSKDDFTRKIISCYELSLKERTLLQQTKLSDFDVLIVYGTEQKLRPTLFDVLADEALDYYKQQDNNYGWRGGNNEQRNISNPITLANTEEFIKANFSSKDTIDKTAKALELYQHLMIFHKRDKSPDALIDLNLSRISWVYTKANFDNKEDLYIKALSEIISNYGNNNIATQAWFNIAKYHSDKAEKYKPFTDTANRYEYQTAINIIDARLNINKDSCEGNNNMRALKKYILQKKLSSKVEAVNEPNQPFRMLLNFKNVDTLFYRVVKLNYKNTINEDDEDYSSDSRLWKKVIKQKSIRNAEQILPKLSDYQEHSTEIKIDALPVGNYAIIGSTGKNFIDSVDNIFYQPFSVSSISYIKNNADFFVVDRDNGKPLSNVNITIINKAWNSGKSKYDYNTVASIKGDETSHFSLNKLNLDSYYNLSFVFSKDNDTLVTTNNYYYRPSINNDYRSEEQAQKENAQVHFFTDRSIYRPGQTVFFKGIITTKTKENKTSLLYFPKQSIKVYLRDANYKNVDSLTVSENEFGSINGQFKIPMNVLTGNFNLIVNNISGNVSFSVEEYKRPKFYVEFDKQKNTYRLNDSITITGNAKAYSGNNIDGAKVVYTVTRNARFENVWMFWRSPQPSSESKQITNGEMKTDANGKFSITFKAEPDAGINKSAQPIFDYSITASVTDLNGETREGNSSISIGYQSTILRLKVDAKIALQDFKDINLSAENLDGEKVSAKVNLSVTSLQLPDRLIRKRYWDRPDVFVMNKDEYINNFPYDEYDNETDRNEWKNKNSNDELRIMNYELKETESKFQIPNSKFQQGIYKVTATTTDKDGQEIKAISYVELFDKVNTTLTYPQYNVEQNIKTLCKAGDTANIAFSTAAKDVYLVKNVVTISNKQGEASNQNHYTYTTVNNQFNLKETITESHKAGMGMYYAFIKHNRFYDGGDRIDFIEPSKKLKISYGTYRNKTLPGSKETYSLKVSGENGEKVAAELLTAMYDASLDQFKRHNWYKPNTFEDYDNSISLNNFSSGDFMEKSSYELYNHNQNFESQYIYNKYSKLSIDIWQFQSVNYYNPKRNYAYSFTPNVSKVLTGRVSGISYMAGSLKSEAKVRLTSGNYRKGVKIAYDTASVMDLDGGVSSMEVREKVVLGDDDSEVNQPQTPNSKQTQIRKNFNETAFFFPNLYADTAGNYSFSFTMPEALTKWNWLSLAHTKDLSFGLSTASVVTQKTLMVQPNAPRFLREGDVMEFTAKISNTSNEELTGTATLELIDATTGNSVDGFFNNVFPLQYFTVAANQSAVVKFPIQVPMNFTKPLTYKVVAITQFPSNGGDKGVVYSDGEENTIPVLTNKIFLTESLPIYLKPNEYQKTIDLKPLFSNASNRTGESMTIEYTANPIWTVVQSLPYLMEYPHECAEQTFNRFFANAMASSIINKNENIRKVISKWKENPSNIKSKLLDNEELKSVLLNETPWVLDAESETEQQKRLALLLDLDKMQSNINSAIDKLKAKQLPSGGFGWFDGGRENEYITQYILTGIGKLQLMNAVDDEQQLELNSIASKALQYLDSRIDAEYKRYLSSLKTKNKMAFFYNSIDYNYWYMRSMFPENKLSTTLLSVKKLFTETVRKNWMKESIYNQGMIAIILDRFDGKVNSTSKKIINSLKENAIDDTAKGTMHWKQNDYCYYWYQNNFETQSLLIQAFAETGNNDIESIEKMKTWLILNKQTNHWNSTIATSGACYALLNYGSNWTLQNSNVSIKIVDKTFQTKTENGDYIKTKLDNLTTNQISTSNSPVLKISTSSYTDISVPTPSYGAVYLQYFADVNDVKSSTSNAPLTLVKKLFIEKNNGTKKVLEPVNENDELSVGDKLIVRIELRANRPMEFLHLKDMRAASTEPVNVLSEYKWQDGLGYYESTKDASTNFFIDNIQKGTYVFDYPLYITHSGTFSVGLASIQCMYAPEFISHSNGIKITVR